MEQHFRVATRIWALQAELLATYFRQVSDIQQKQMAVLEEEITHQAHAVLEFPALRATFHDYLIDQLQRSILFWDVLRQRGDDYRDHVAKGQPPVLAFPYKMLLDGRTLERPVNYGLIEVLAPAGSTTDRNKRPFIIVDPRSGHGPGISGFKDDSQVGIALRAGHPVYFLIFFPEPEAQQTLFDIAAAEERFLREVATRHPNSPKPCVIGNCQGGWAMLALAAAHPELSGAIIANGVPLSYWSGQNGKNPMRYLGGLFGGTWLAQLAGDLGHGKFDGAHLILNFALINPVASYYKKYYELFAHIDEEEKRYLALERWLGGFTAMTTREMRSIADNLFMGNKLVRGKIPLDRKNNLDLRNLRTPLIIFCSQGDEVVPPQQALHWISDLYSDVLELKLEGQVIVYHIHDTVGHLGLFMSSKVAQKEHRQIIDLLHHIEQLPPGLYELVIHEETAADGTMTAIPTLEERSIADIQEMQEEHKLDNKLFDFVHHVSSMNATLYDLFVSPWVRAVVQEDTADLARQLHPLRLSRSIASEMNPLLWPIEAAAPLVRENRRNAGKNNAFAAFQNKNADLLFRAMNTLNEGRDAAIELLFHGIYGSLYEFAQHDSQRHLIVEGPSDHEDDESTRYVLSLVGEGGTPEAVIRILLLLIKTQGFARVVPLSESVSELRKHALFSHFNNAEFRQIVQNQTVIVEYDPELALKSLPQLLKLKKDKALALELVRSLIGNLHAPVSEEILRKTREIQDLFAEG